MALVVKNPPANARDVRDTGFVPGSGRSPGGGRGNPLRYSSLGNPTPWTEEPGGLQFMGSQRVGHDWSNLACVQTRGGANVGCFSEREVMVGAEMVLSMT